jgi:DNA-binding GntR family transcriptional regulator
MLHPAATAARTTTTGSSSARRSLEAAGPFKKRPGVSLHHQIKDDLFHRLRSGDWPPGTELPPETALCAYYDVSRGTLRRAVAELVAEGYIERHSGQGSFVCHPKLESGVTSSYSRMSVVGPEVDPGGQILFCRSATPNPHIASVMGSGDPVWRLERVRFTRQQPVALQTSFIPVALCPDLGRADLKTRHLVEVMREKYGIHLGRAVEYLEPAVADGHVSKHLSVPLHAPVFHIERSTYTVEGRIVEYRNAYLRGDIYRYRVELR